MNKATMVQEEKIMKRILIVSLCVLMTLLGIACADNSNAKSDVASETISVPNVVGMNLDDAKEVIKESGLVIGNIEYIDNKENASDTVLQQSPKAGDEVDSGEAVELEVVAE